nr:putative ORF1 [Marmot picobirnavirus]
MTHNQIEYWKMREQHRSNQANEGETFRHNTVTEREARRHNQAGEAFSLSNLSEVRRHNKAAEAFNLSSLAEQSRHNIANEQYNLSSLSELNRHNTTQESLTGSAQKETVRHDRANELLELFEEGVRLAGNKWNYNINLRKLSQDLYKWRGDQRLKKQYYKLDKLKYRLEREINDAKVENTSTDTTKKKTEIGKNIADTILNIVREAKNTIVPFLPSNQD